MLLLWIRGVLSRRFLRVAGAAAGIAVAVALLVTLAGGFVTGLWWLDALIRRRHGGFRIY